MDAEMEKLIRRHEAGDFVTYNEFGKKIFRNLNGLESYNRVDKINLNNPKIVSPEKTGKNQFALAEDIKQPHTRDYDNLHIQQQVRHTSGAYLPRKGVSPYQANIEQTQSSIGSLIKNEEAKSDDTKSAKRIDNRDRDGHDFIQWNKGVPEDEKVPIGKKKLNPPGGYHSGNILQWQ